MKKLTLRRSGARGDVLLATTLFEALSKRYDEIYFSTSPACALLVSENPHIKGVIGKAEIIGELIDLDDTYERTPLRHVVSAYAEAAGVGEEETTQAQLRHAMTPNLYDVILHPTISWASRTLPVVFWQRLAWALLDTGKRVAVVRARNEPKLTTDIDDYCDLSFKGVASLIASSRLFIGGDSLPMHLAATTQTPIIGLFTVALPKYRAPWKRDEKLFRGILANVECVGCLHRETPPVRFAECRLDAALKNRCVEAFDPAFVFAEAKEFLK